MRELERDQPSDAPAPVRPGIELARTGQMACVEKARVAVVGAGRLGSALASALGRTGRFEVTGPLARGSSAPEADAVVLCVPDGEIGAAAALIAPGRLVGHCSGATGLDALSPHEAFSIHPLMTVTSGETSFTGAGAAVDGTTSRALGFARELATALGMQPVRVEPEDRAIYHAAASMASNFLVTLESAAEHLAERAGLERELLVPLVRATVENWAALGPQRALTGPVARGDESTVRRQREAVEERAPELLPLFDALVDATRAVAHPPVVETQPA